jgi:hypothetical protein
MFRDDFNKGMRRLQANFGKTLTPDEADVYWTVLQDVEIEDFHDGIREICYSDRQFMPRPGQIRKACGVGARGKGTWAEQAAGAAELDPDRPARIGRNLADAEKQGDEPRRVYYETMIRHMNERDRLRAEDAYRAEHPGGGR